VQFEGLNNMNFAKYQEIMKMQYGEAGMHPGSKVPMIQLPEQMKVMTSAGALRSQRGSVEKTPNLGSPSLANSS
jgi:hypothetical protein